MNPLLLAVPASSHQTGWKSSSHHIHHESYSRDELTAITRGNSELMCRLWGEVTPPINMKVQVPLLFDLGSLHPGMQEVGGWSDVAPDKQIFKLCWNSSLAFGAAWEAFLNFFFLSNYKLDLNHPDMIQWSSCFLSNPANQSISHSLSLPSALIPFLNFQKFTSYTPPRLLDTFYLDAVSDWNHQTLLIICTTIFILIRNTNKLASMFGGWKTAFRHPDV